MNDPLYVATRNKVLSSHNPYFSRGQAFFGVGGPHVGVVNAWPMALISSIYGSDDDQEIMDDLYTIMNVRDCDPQLRYRP